MYPYRVFIKDCLNLGGLPIANSVCLTFTIDRDLLSVATSDFTLLDMPTNIKEGDVLGLSDPYGTVLYTGVIKSIGDNIQCRAITSIFNDNWKYHDTSDTTIEGKIKRIIEDDFINSSDPMVSDRFPFTVSVSSSTSGTIEAKDDTAVMDFQTFLMNMYDVYGVITDIKVPFNGTPTIELKQATHSSIKVGNNALPIQNMTPLTEVFETNKLVIYDKEGTTLRGTFYTTSQGITTNANDPLRLPVTKTKFIFNTDDAVNDIKQENLQEEIYNHKITFDLLLNNGLYDFFDWELGMPIEVWYNGEYFNTIFTKYSMSKDMNVDVTSVSITCGKVRNTLTEKINSYATPQEQYVGSSSATDYYENPSWATWNSSAATSDRTFQLWRYGNVITGRIAFNTNGAVANGASFTPITFSNDAVDVISATWREMFSVVDGGTYSGRVLTSAVDTWNTAKKVYIWNKLGASLPSGSRLLISFTWVV